MNRLKLVIAGGVREQISQLPKEQQIEVLRVIDRLCDQHLHGKALGDHDDVGDLRDCFKVYFDADRDRSPRFRLVYRQGKRNMQLVAVQIIAVGYRQGLQAYVQAALTLDRYPHPTTPLAPPATAPYILPEPNGPTI